MTEPTRIYRMDTGESVRVDLPDGIGYVEIRANNVHGPTGYPAIGVSVVILLLVAGALAAWADRAATPAEHAAAHPPK